MSVQKNALGRGLASLLGEHSGATSKDSRTLSWVPLTRLRPSPYQPRKVFSEQALEQMAQSIESQGILQPLLAREASDGTLEIIAGERRWRAAQRTSRKEVPVIIVDYSDQQVMEAALVENIQRENLNPIEEAESYKKLIEEHKYTQEELSKIVGKSRSHIANILRLLGLPIKIQELIMQGTISFGHARALLAMDHPEDILHEILQKGLSVRQVEKASRKKKDEDIDVQEKSELEDKISEILRVKVSLSFDGEGGALKIFFKSFEELDRLMASWHHLRLAQEDERQSA